MDGKLMLCRCSCLVEAAASPRCQRKFSEGRFLTGGSGGAGASATEHTCMLVHSSVEYGSSQPAEGFVRSFVRSCVTCVLLVSLVSTCSAAVSQRRGMCVFFVQTRFVVYCTQPVVVVLHVIGS